MTRLHEQSPNPVSGRTTREVTATNRRGEIIERKTEAFLGGMWYTIARDLMTCNSTGKRVRTENLAGQVTATAWDCCHKVYADGKGPKYEYDVHGQLAKRTWARGIDTFYAYDGWGNLTNTTYSDTTPTISLSYDAMGRQVRAVDAAGMTTFVYDAAGRRVACAKSGSAFATPDTCAYRYNARSELTNAMASVDAAYRYGYEFDDIGNRETSSERGTNSVYTANDLNQYTAVDDFVPQFDDDGNQTLVKTATGVWQVVYNGENRPVRWELVDTVVTMTYDRMGRRVSRNEWRFVYDGYLQISDNGGNSYIWDPVDPIATRPLVWKRGDGVAYYFLDGNKNVSDVIASDGTFAAHYEYAPFGAVTAKRGTFAATNPWRFSSEYAEDDTTTIYYNYRHFSSVCGRWLARDPVLEIAAQSQQNLPKLLSRIESTVTEQRESSYYSFWQDYIFVDNKPRHTDVLGLLGKYDPPPPYVEVPFPPCCPSQRASCNAVCRKFKNFSKALCDLNFLFVYRCRCVCRWEFKDSASSGFPGYTRDFDCTYINATGRRHTIGYYSQPTWFRCPTYIELGCP